MLYTVGRNEGDSLPSWSNGENMIKNKQCFAEVFSHAAARLGLLRRPAREIILAHRLRCVT
jgi:hypothetical protein